jgi:uncharacterized protein YbjT (DUF2867 family)
MNQRVLVIGGQGMLGRPIVRRLLQDGFHVRVLARNPEKARSVLPAPAEVVNGDLENPGTIDAALNDCGAVYLSVDTPPNARFKPETDGLRNFVFACKNHTKTRLMVLSALGSSDPACESHPWWHARLKHEAQKIAKNSGLSWTIFEPAWFMESLPLFVRKKTFTHIKNMDFKSYWIAGDDYARMISASLSKNIGQGEIVPAQGREKISFREAARQFIQSYDPGIRTMETPVWILKLAGFFAPKVKELKTLFEVCGSMEEPAPNPEIWKRYASPAMNIESYVQYVRQTSDFPQK